MAKKMEPIVKKWYDYLADGKLMGLKCEECGTVHFPPFPICRECAGTNMEWVEMSGKAQVDGIALTLSPDHWFAEYAPFYNADGKTAEGSNFSTILLGLDPMSDQDDIFNNFVTKLPVQVEIEIQDRGDYHYPVYRYTN